MSDDAPEVDYLVIGHVTQDLTPAGPRLGGTAAYAALTAQACGVRVGIVTAAAPDARLDELQPLPALRLPSESNTTFENVYTPAGRVQYVRAVAAPLGPAAVPLQWRRAAIVHLGPVAGEVDPHLAAHFPTALVGVTPQGWLREWDETGRVHPRAWPEAQTVIAQATVTIMGLADVGHRWELAEEWARPANVFVVTDGPRGCTVFWGGERRAFPAPPAREVDPTGAGDIFAAAFFIRLWETRDAWEAARFANCLASLSVTRAGLGGAPTIDEVAGCRGSH